MTASLTYMRAEIDEAGAAIARQLAGDAGRIDRLGRKLRALDPPVLTTIARGSSDCCALYLKYLAEIVVGIPCASIGPSIATLYGAPLRLSRAAAVSISQSGRSPDIVEMQRSARKAGATTIAMVNEVDSPLATEAEELLPLMAGREQSVAATKSMIAGLVAGAALVAAWRGDADLMDAIAGLPAILPAESAPPPCRHDRTARARRTRLCARTRRDLRGRHRSGVEAQGDLRNSRRSLLVGGSAARARRAGAIRLPRHRLHADRRRARRHGGDADAAS